MKVNRKKNVALICGAAMALSFFWGGADGSGKSGGSL